MLSRKTEILLALLMLALGAGTLFLWAPLDSGSPAVHVFRRQTLIGDALLPMVAGAGITLCSAVLLLRQIVRKQEPAPPPFDRQTAVFFAAFGAMIALSLALMYWSGPAALALFGPLEGAGYRQMRAAVPWKYAGFVLGGFTMVFGLTSLIEGRVRATRAAVALAAVVLLILIFDVPFDSILLPPNGDF